MGGGAVGWEFSLFYILAVLGTDKEATLVMVEFGFAMQYQMLLSPDSDSGYHSLVIVSAVQLIILYYNILVTCESYFLSAQSWERVKTDTGTL